MLHPWHRPKPLRRKQASAPPITCRLTILTSYTWQFFSHARLTHPWHPYVLAARRHAPPNTSSVPHPSLGNHIHDHRSCSPGQLYATCSPQSNVDDTVKALRSRGLEVAGCACHVGSAEQRKQLVAQCVQVGRCSQPVCVAGALREWDTPKPVCVSVGSGRGVGGGAFTGSSRQDQVAFLSRMRCGFSAWARAGGVGGPSCRGMWCCVLVRGTSGA